MHARTRVEQTELRPHSPVFPFHPKVSSKSCHLIAVEEFECPKEPRSYVVGGYSPLVGSPKANWF